MSLVRVGHCGDAWYVPTNMRGSRRLRGYDYEIRNGRIRLRSGNIEIGDLVFLVFGAEFIAVMLSLLIELLVLYLGGPPVGLAVLGALHIAVVGLLGYGLYNRILVRRCLRAAVQIRDGADVAFTSPLALFKTEYDMLLTNADTCFMRILDQSDTPYCAVLERHLAMYLAEAAPAWEAFCEYDRREGEKDQATLTRIKNELRTLAEHKARLATEVVRESREKYLLLQQSEEDRQRADRVTEDMKARTNAQQEMDD